jgi:hypothetical protein
VRLDLSELDALAAQLAQLTNDINDPASLRSAVREEAEAIRKTWRDDARVKAGAHGKHYPASITYETRTTGTLRVEAEIGPDPSRKQGGMSFEFGSRNQPPHLSGQKAAQEAEGRLEQRMNDWLDGVGL